ncbi:MAG: hypothetical protein JSV03_13025 [Planctomycetota bacterium]|nr:MAG: hypothetical protein JSV03_13025 [Planctomycetota bacterium]
MKGNPIIHLGVLTIIVGTLVSTTAQADPLIPAVLQERVILKDYPPDKTYDSDHAYDIVKSGNYLYVAGYPGLDAVEIYEDPGEPGVKKLSWLDAHRLGTGHHMYGVAVPVQYPNLYTAYWSPWCGLTFYSLADPAHPLHLGQRDTGYHTFHVEVQEDVLYVSRGVSDPGSIIVYDIATNPASPAEKKRVNPTGAASHITNAVRFGDYLYFGAGRYIYVYNSVDAYNPTYVTKRTIESLSTKLAIYDNYLFVGSEENIPYSGNNPGGIYVLSLANPASPVNVEAGNAPAWTGGSGTRVKDLHIQGHYLAIPWNTNVLTFDISDPENIIQIPGQNPIRILWDDDGDGTPESPKPNTMPPYQDGDEFHDGYAHCITGAGNYIYVGTTTDGGHLGTESIYGARVYSIQIAEGEIEDPTDEVWVDLDSPDIENGVVHPEGGDGDTVPVEQGGRWCRQNVNPSEDFYFMFKVSDSYVYAGSKPDLYIGIDYYDEGYGSLTLQYDAPGHAYTNGGSVTLTNTLTWKQHVYHITDAYFANRQNFDADFRIFGGTNTTFYLDVVHVAEEPPIPAIELSLASIVRSVPSGVSLSNDGFLVSNVGRGTLYYTITDDAGWLEVSPDNGKNRGDTDIIDVVYSTSGLTTGNYPATITVVDPNSSNSPQTISVLVQILVAGDFDPADGDVDQEDFGFFQNCYSGDGKLYQEGCEAADFDSDLDIDLSDFAKLYNCMAGANNPPGC